MTKTLAWKTLLVGPVLAASLLTAACGTVGGAAVGAGSGAAIGAGTGYGAGKGAAHRHGRRRRRRRDLRHHQAQMTGGVMTIWTRFGAAVAAPSFCGVEPLLRQAT